MNKSKTHNFDAHWKIIITELFEDFVQFYLPELYPEIDFSVSPESLQQELEQMIKDEEMKGKIINDKLIKVKLKNGKEQYILIHIEIQSYKDETFQQRMFRYFSRIYDAHPNKDITAIAIYTGKWRPENHDRFVKAKNGKGVYYIYHSYWVEEADINTLKASENPFALAVLAAKQVNATYKKPVKRLKYKKELINLMNERQYSDKQIWSVLTFIKFMMILPKEQELEFRQHFNEIFMKGENIDPEYAKQRHEFGMDIVKMLLGKSVEEQIEEQVEEQLKKQVEQQLKKQVEQQLEEKVLATSYNLLKAGVSAKIVALSLNLPIEKIVEIQAQLNMGKA